MHFIDSIKFSSSQVHATVHSSALQLGICTDNAISSCVRSIDGFSHNMSFTSETRGLRSSFAQHFLFLISHYQVCLSHLLWIRQDRVCVFLRLCLMLHRHSSSFLLFFFYTRRNGVHKPLQPTLENVSVEIRSSRPHFRLSFCWTCIHELFTSTGKDRTVGIRRIANTQEFHVPGIDARKSSPE